MTYSYGDSCCNQRSVTSDLLPCPEDGLEVWARQTCRTGWIRLSVWDTAAEAAADCQKYRAREWSFHYNRIEVV